MKDNGLFQFTFFSVLCSIFCLVNISGTSGAATGQSNAVQKLLNDLNTDVKPCDNFYDYVCSKWNARHLDLSKVQNGFVRKTIRNELLDILSGSDKSDDIDEVKAARKFHKSCINAEEINKRGIEPIISILEQNGGWPLMKSLSEWNSDAYTWQNVDAAYRRLLGLSALFNVTTFVERENVMIPYNIIGLEPPSFHSRPSFLSDTKVFSHEKFVKYLKFVLNIALSFVEKSGSLVPAKDVVSSALDMILFEKKLMMAVREAETDYMYEQYTVSSVEALQEKFSNASSTARINWHEVIPGTFKDLANIDVADNQKILLHNIAYLHKLIPILEETPTQIIVNYVHWNFVINMLQYTSGEMEAALENMKESISGIRKREESRDVQCLSQNALKRAVYYQFGKNRLPENVEAEVSIMIERIGNALLNAIIKSDADNVMIEHVKKILAQVPRFIGSSDNYKDASAIKTYYEGLTIDEQYFENIIASTKFQYQMSLKRFKTYSKEDVDIPPVTTIGFYDKLLNSKLVVPASMLQEPFFSMNQPKPLNYGGLGGIIAYMLFNLYRDGVSMTGKILEDHLDDLECFKSWSNTSATNSQIGQRGIRRRSASYVALNLAYEAYRASKDAADVGNQSNSFNDQQLFFVSYAKSQCVANFDSKRSSDPVTVSVANNQDFGKVFNCTLDTPMNRVDKCDLLRRHW